MDTPNDMARLQLAWAALDRQVARQGDLLLQQARQGAVASLRKRLRALRWGQMLQIVLGLALIVAAVPVWSTYRDLPHVFVSGLVLHAYGVATIMLGGITLARLARLDYAAPVVALQTRLLQTQTFYIRASTALGLAWWLLWIPFAIVAFTWIGVDFAARTAPAMPWMLAGGVAGLVATGVFHRWARGRPALYARMRAGMAGRSFTAVNAELQAMREMERE